jgi:membrane protein YqaA with SNARE-associated domain
MPFQLFIDNAYASIFISSFLAATIIPFGPEGVLAYFINQNFDLLSIIIAATLGSYLGTVLNYYVGFQGSNILLNKIINFNGDQVEKAKGMFRKYGPIILFFSWMPILGDPLTFVAGLLKFDFSKFTIYVILGKAVRFVVVSAVIAGILQI